MTTTGRQTASKLISEKIYIYQTITLPKLPEHKNIKQKRLFVQQKQCRLMSGYDTSWK